MAKWEYTNFIFYKDGFLDFLTDGIHEYGREGWEMCGVSTYTAEEETIYVIIFKRKI